MRILFVIFFMFTFVPLLIAQSHAEKDEGIRVSLAIGHTYLPRDTQEGRELAILPSFGLDVEYWFHKRWGIGLHNDLELQTFEIQQNHDQVIIEREFPILITLDGLFRVYHGLIIYAGPGIELEKSRNFFVTRLGIEYEIDIGGGWDIHPSFFHDVRKDAYDTYSVSLGVAKRF